MRSVYTLENGETLLTSPGQLLQGYTGLNTELRETTFPPWTANGYTGHLKRALILGMDKVYQIRKDNKVRLLLLEFT